MVALASVRKSPAFIDSPGAVPFGV